MKLKKGVLQRKTGDSIALVVNRKDSSFTGVLHSNPTAALIIKCLKHNTNEKRILAKMKRKFDGDPDEMLEDIRAILDELRKANVIDE
ncbi:MAG: PqqD family protein [Clostridia bacterium]|nr:PqqD family protein [Clostridia bacterium]